MTDDHQRRGLIADLTRRLALASHDELRVLDAILVRLELGRERYGLLDLARPRDWAKERREEQLDAVIYDVAGQLAAQDRERAELREAARAEMFGGHRVVPISAVVIDTSPLHPGPCLGTWCSLCGLGGAR